jgi:hypothetical protein
MAATAECRSPLVATADTGGDTPAAIADNDDDEKSLGWEEARECSQLIMALILGNRRLFANLDATLCMRAQTADAGLSGIWHWKVTSPRILPALRELRDQCKVHTPLVHTVLEVFFLSRLIVPYWASTEDCARFVAACRPTCMHRRTLSLARAEIQHPSFSLADGPLFVLLMIPYYEEGLDAVDVGRATRSITAGTLGPYSVPMMLRCESSYHYYNLYLAARERRAPWQVLDPVANRFTLAVAAHLGDDFQSHEYAQYMLRPCATTAVRAWARLQVPGDCDGCGASRAEHGGGRPFRPCPRCRVFWYCSRACQARSWTEGCHRSSCRGWVLAQEELAHRLDTLGCFAKRNYETFRLLTLRTLVGGSPPEEPAVSASPLPPKNRKSAKQQAYGRGLSLLLAPGLGIAWKILLYPDPRLYRPKPPLPPS